MKPCKSPHGCWIERMPKRLREHMRAKEIARESEPPPYEWPCIRCGFVFLPQRNPEWLVKLAGEFTKFCAGCALDNLINGLCDTEEERAEFRAALGRKNATPTQPL